MRLLFILISQYVRLRVGCRNRVLVHQFETHLKITSFSQSPNRQVAAVERQARPDPPQLTDQKIRLQRIRLSGSITNKNCTWWSKRLAGCSYNLQYLSTSLIFYSVALTLQSTNFALKCILFTNCINRILLLYLYRAGICLWWFQSYILQSILPTLIPWLIVLLCTSRYRPSSCSLVSSIWLVFS